MERAETERRVANFLASAAAVVTTSIREQLDTRRVVFDWYERRAEQETLGDLANRVAALLSRNPNELDQLRLLFTKCFREAAPPLLVAPPTSVRLISAQAVGLGPRARLLIGAAVLCALAVAAGPSVFPPNEGPAGSGGKAAGGSVGAPESGQTSRAVTPNGSDGGPELIRDDNGLQGTTELTPERTVRQTAIVSDKIQGNDAWCLVLSFIALFVSMRFLLVVDVSSKLRKIDFDQRMRAAREKRRQLAAESAARGEPEVLTYHVPRYLPFSRRELDDMATALARAYLEHVSDDLDVRETIDATVASGGRFSPYFAATRATRPLLVLVDIENDDHPWLASIERTLDALQRLGVLAVRYHFKHRPNALFAVRGGTTIGFDDACRRFGDSALLIISENLDPRDFEDQTAGWVKQLGSFVYRGWIDPNPREPSGKRAARVAELAGAGLPRFPFSAAGWVAAGRILGGAALPSVPVPELPRLEQRVTAAVRAWALTAALVPDATWDQLEAIRRDPAFPEIGRVLTAPHHLQLLLEWVQSKTNSNAVSGDGRVLFMPDEFVLELIEEQRISDRAGTGPPLEQRARELLLRQLDPERPTGAWAKMRWELKRATHHMVLDPESTRRLLQSFEGTAIEELALQVMGTELSRQEAGLVLRGRKISAQTRAQFEKQSGIGSNVEIGRLGIGMGSLYFKAFIYALGLTALVAIVFAAFGNGLEEQLVRGKVSLEVTLPAVFAVSQKPPSQPTQGASPP